jgi:hypothetical protein
MKLFDRIYYNFVFDKKVRNNYIRLLVFIIISFFVFLFGYKYRDSSIFKLHDKISFLKQSKSELFTHIDSLDNELLEFKQMKEDGDYYRYIAYKFANINIPESVPTDDLILLDSLQEHYKIPKKYLYRLINKESRYNPKAKSPVGAYGYMQIMPTTYTSLHKKYITKNKSINHLPKRQQNLILGCFYLNDLYSRYDDWKLTFAAYNAGSGNVKKYNGIPPFAETQKYVKYICQK